MRLLRLLTHTRAGSIREGTTEAHVRDAFSAFGPIDSLAVKTNRQYVCCRCLRVTRVSCPGLQFRFCEFQEFERRRQSKAGDGGQAARYQHQAVHSIHKGAAHANLHPRPALQLPVACPPPALTPLLQADARRGGDDGRPERRIEREPIQREQQDTPAASEQQQQQQQSDASSSPSQERGASPAAEGENVEEVETSGQAGDEVEVPSVACAHTADA